MSFTIYTSCWKLVREILHWTFPSSAQSVFSQRPNPRSEIINAASGLSPEYCVGTARVTQPKNLTLARFPTIGNVRGHCVGAPLGLSRSIRPCCLCLRQRCLVHLPLTLAPTGSLFHPIISAGTETMSKTVRSPLSLAIELATVSSLPVRSRDIDNYFPTSVPFKPPTPTELVSSLSLCPMAV